MQQQLSCLQRCVNQPVLGWSHLAWLVDALTHTGKAKAVTCTLLCMNTLLQPLIHWSI